MNNHRYLLTVLSTCCFLSISNRAQAAEQAPAAARPYPTGIEVGAGLNAIVPYGNLRLNYDFDPHWTGNLAFQVGPTFSATTGPRDLSAITTAGAKYYFTHQGWFQPFVGADLGVAILPDNGLFGQVGVGSDLMFDPRWGISIAVHSNLRLLNSSLMSGTLAFRPEISTVWRF